MKSQLTLFFYVLGVFLIFVIACNNPYSDKFRNFYYSENELLHSKKTKVHQYLKAHDYHGQVYIFDKDWNLDTSTLIIQGKGKFYSTNREILQIGDIMVHVDSIVLFETNRSLENDVSPHVTPKALIALGNVLLAGYCISVPKACFGSCPTFYAKENKNNVFLTNAEGFSNAITPSMEYRDVDDLGLLVKNCTSFPIFMKNEALETHVVKSVDVLAIPCNGDEEICHGTDNKFYASKNTIPLLKASFEEENISSLLECNDGREWTSLADPDTLVTKGEIILEYDPYALQSSDHLGLKLTFRQTLMTTYMFYHAISYMGDEYSDILSKMETNKKEGEDILKKFFNALGGIDVYMLDDSQNRGQWVFQGKYYETGPIAKNTQICVFPSKINQKPSKNIKIKLVFNKGLWRFEEALLLTIKNEVYPFILSPQKVNKNKESSPVSLQNLLDKNTHLISMPGDEFELLYKLPCEANNYRVFLASQGYYLEWMRHHWLADKDLSALKKMLHDPVHWLNIETRKYKKYELQMEQDFYNSRVESNQKDILKELSLQN